MVAAARSRSDVDDTLCKKGERITLKLEGPAIWTELESELYFMYTVCTDLTVDWVLLKYYA